MLNWMIEVFGNTDRLHVGDPASAAGMYGVADFLLALENGNLRACRGSRLRRAQSGRSTTNDQYIDRTRSIRHICLPTGRHIAALAHGKESRLRLSYLGSEGHV